MQNQAVYLVERMVEITEYRENELMEESLVRTLQQTLPCREVELYKVARIRGTVVLHPAARVDAYGVVESGLPCETVFSPEISRCIHACIEEQQVVVHWSPASSQYRIIHPVCPSDDGAAAILILNSDVTMEDERALVSGLLRIYANFLQILTESQTDKLTGLLNRQTFERRIMDIVAQGPNPSPPQPPPNSRRRPFHHSSTYWLALVDIDHFKKVNDQFGHLYGDEVLLILAHVMKTTFRSEDLLFRYGGEEFLVVFSAPSSDDAQKALERFRSSVERHAFPQIDRVTISAGYTQLVSPELPVDILARADEALYYAKEHGRNRVCCYESLTSTGEIETPCAPTAGEIEIF